MPDDIQFGPLTIPAEKQGLPPGLLRQIKTELFGLEVLLGQASALPPPRTCGTCKEGFFILGREGVRTPPDDEACPFCSPKWLGPTGGEAGVDLAQVSDFLADHTGMEHAADVVVRETGDSRPKVLATLKTIEQDPVFQMGLRKVLAVQPDRTVAWVTALRLYVDGPAAARCDPLAAEVLARGPGYLDPNDVERIVAKVRGKEIYKGPVDGEAGRMLKEMEKHGRNLVVTCHMKDGSTRRYRGNGERTL